MHSNTTNINIKEVETQLREEKSKFAKAFHRGKSMSELKDVVDKIHTLEQKFSSLTLFNYNSQ